MRITLRTSLLFFPVFLFSCGSAPTVPGTEVYRFDLPLGYKRVLVEFDSSANKRMLTFAPEGNMLVELSEDKYMDSSILNVHPILKGMTDKDDSLTLDITSLRPGIYRMDYSATRIGGREFVLDLRWKK